MKKFLFRALQLLVTIAVLAWIFRDPSMRRNMMAALHKADPLWIMAGLFVSGIGEVANIIRWGLFLRAQNVKASWARIAAVFMVGVFFGLFLLGTAGGDVLKAFLLIKERQNQKAAILLTILADRLVGLLILLPFTFGLVLLRYQWLSQTPVARGLLYLLFMFSGGSVLFIGISLFLARPGVAEKLPAGLPGRAGLVEIASAYRLFASAWVQSLLAVLLSIPVLFTFFGTFYCASQAFHARISLADIFSIMPIVTFVTSLPVSISGLGLREEMFKNLLGDLSHVPPDVAVLVSLTGFLIYVVWSLVGAVAYIWARPDGLATPAASSPS